MWEMVNRLGPKAFRKLLQELVTETTPPDRENFLSTLRTLPSTEPDREAQFTAVRAFREREVIKSELDLLLTPARDLNQFSERLEAISEALLIFTVETLRMDLTERNGEPCPCALFALGKFGGEELGAGSDLEVLLIYREPDQTRGPENLSHGEFYEQLCRRLLRFLQTRPGETLALDLRLRPHGESGPLAVSLSAWKEYFAPGGGALDYEKQALIRLRFIHGDEELGRDALALRDAVTYTDPPVPIVRTLELHAKQAALKTKPGMWNAKYSEGGMTGLEYSIQFLQLTQGAFHPLARQPNLARAMEALLETGALSLAEFEHLYAAQVFLRRLINALRLVRGQARDLHCPAPDSPEFSFLAKRMGYVHREGTGTEAQLECELGQTRRVVSGFFQYRFHKGTKPEWLNDSLSEALMDPGAGMDEAAPALLRLGMRDLPRARRLFLEFFHLMEEKRLAAACLLIFEGRLRRNPDPEGVIQKLNLYLERLKYPDVFIRQALHHPDLLEMLLLVFANSDTLSNLAVREGENFKTLIQPEALEKPRMPEDFDGLVSQALRDPSLGENRTARLCRLRNREYLRIALRDLGFNVPLREITHEISRLSDALLKAAWDQASEIPGHSAGQTCVLALGKLGGLELNYSSDIDLVFIAEDRMDGEDGREACEKAGRELIGFLTRDTREGRLFRVDMNLRPWGGSGPLAGTVGQYRDYYRREAGGWELQAWLKARPICGNVSLGGRFIREVQQLACAPENREKVETSMRKVRLMGLDKLYRDELLAGEVKLGPGGIRTVEFYAQALQIRHGAEIPELLTGNTLEALGRLNRYQLLASERFQMLTHAYVFLRRIEHRLQLQGLQQRHALPTDSAELNRLARQMGFEDHIGQSAVKGFMEQYRKHMLSLQSISAELFAH
jgi:glutamate-ammonia-ligase adenylyltransferase